MNKRNLFPIIVSAVILVASLTLMARTPAKEMDYYSYAQSLDLIEIIDSPDLTMEMLEGRNGKLIIEQVVGKVTDAETGAGYIIGYPEYYIGYARVDGIKNGDVVCSYMIYNPDNNYEDDILIRFDYIIDSN